jgi:hypothetical protein
MDQFILSTEHLDERHQFACWREECMQRMVGITPERAGNRGFAGTVTASISEAVVRLQMRSEDFIATRGSQDIARVGWQDSISLVRHIGDGVLYKQSGREQQRLGQRDFLAFDPSLPIYADAKTARWWSSSTTIAATASERSPIPSRSSMVIRSSRSC